MQSNNDLAKDIYIPVDIYLGPEQIKVLMEEKSFVVYDFYDVENRVSINIHIQYSPDKRLIKLSNILKFTC